ncbi:MAG: hypothetical protein AAF961_07290, partial [Planctomycetota bacterium]
VTDLLFCSNSAWSLSVDRSPNKQVVADRAEALAWAATIAEPGDVVVVTGGRARPQYGFEIEESFADDADVVREMLYARHRSVPALRLVG